MNQGYHLYTISFTVGKESGIALVAAGDEKSAFQILKNGGSRCSDNYKLIQIRDIGMSASCTYGLLMESFVNALEAYDAILNAANHFIKGDKGESIWAEIYVDNDMYLHVLETAMVLSPRLSFDQTTGYLTLY